MRIAEKNNNLYNNNSITNRENSRCSSSSNNNNNNNCQLSAGRVKKAATKYAGNYQQKDRTK